jgi:hypothetical protein
VLPFLGIMLATGALLLAFPAILVELTAIMN